MDEILKIPVGVNENTAQLRLVYDKISINIRGLDSSGVSSSCYGSLLIPVIMSKLPTKIRVQVARSTAHVVWECPISKMSSNKKSGHERSAMVQRRMCI